MVYDGTKRYLCTKNDGIIPQEEGKMKKRIILVALLLSMITLVACAGSTPRPVIIKDGKIINEPEGLISTVKRILE